MLLYVLVLLCILWQGLLTALLLCRRGRELKTDELAERRERLLTEGLESLLSYSVETAMKEGKDN